MKTAFIGIDILYPVLEALSRSGVEISRIFTCDTDNITEFNTRVAAFARERGIALQRERLRQEDLIRLAEAGCEAVLCAGYYHRIPVIPDLPIVNVHPSLLPRGRGPWPMPCAILRGEKELGVTFHRMTAELDAGPILLQRPVAVLPGDDLEALTVRLGCTAAEMTAELMADFDRLWRRAVPQREEEAEYWPCPTEADWTVREDMTPEEADRILRAFFGYEVIYEGSSGRYELIRASLRGTPPLSGPRLPVGGLYAVAERVRRLEGAVPCGQEE